MELVRKNLKELGLARMVIVGFVLVLFVLAVLKDMQVAQLISDSLARVGRNGILVLALLPAVRGGTGLNFGLPIGILCGLVGMIVGMELELTGLGGFLAAVTLAGLLATIAGFFYGKLLNKVKGDEMTVGTYLGFAMVSLMCIFWSIAPFESKKMIWTIGGQGLRVTISLEDFYLHVLDSFLHFQIFGVDVPTGALLFFALSCLAMAYFFKTKAGKRIAAAGQNPSFAKASGVDSEKTRVQAVILSTVIAAIGIIVYNQSFGFVQLYTAPLLMAFPIVACLLIGGADVNNATIFHVVFGTIVFQTLLTVALPVTSRFIQGDISEVARIIISNGIILYALAGIKTKKA